MTIQITSSYTRAAGNGVTTVFPFAFKVFSASDLVVRDILDSTGIPTTKTLTTDYGVAISVTDEGGSVSFTAAPASGHTIDIRRTVPLTQPEDIRNQGRFLPEIHEGVFDKLEAQIQDTRRLLSLAPRMPDSESTTIDWDTLLSLSNRKGKYFGFFNAMTGTPELYTSIGATSLSQSVIGQFLFPQTAAEVSAGVTPTNYAIPSHDAAGHVLVARYGTNSVPGTTEMYTPIANALLVAQAAGGMVVRLDKGKFKVSTAGLVVPPGCSLKGSGTGTGGGTSATGTTIVHAIAAANSVAVTLGNNDTALSYGCGFADLNILMTQANTIGLVLRATQNANISNVLIFGDQVNKTYTGIEIRAGSSVSCFANLFQDVYCLYMHRGLRFVDIGGTFATTAVCVNFQAVYNTADDPTSIGVDFTDTSGPNGLNSVFLGGNLEGLGKGVKFANTTQGTTWCGMRFELNTADIDWGTPSGTGRNTFFGYGYTSFVETGTRGDNNVIFGQYFGDVRISRGKGNLTRNIAVGDTNLQNTTSGTINVGVGVNALAALTTGTQNTAIGDSSLTAVQGGNNNAACGMSALSGVTSGGANVGVGFSAGSSVTTGSNNTAVGQSAQAGSDGSNNTAIGNGAGAASSPHQIVAGESNRIVVGNNSVTNAYIVTAWTVTSDQRDKRDIQPLVSGLDVVKALAPIRYRFDARSRYEDGISDGSKANRFESSGFSAQNVKAALESAGLPAELCVDTSDPEHLGLTESRLIPFLVIAIHELAKKVNG